MTVQFATLRENFARQMEDYRRRRAQLLKAELEKRGIDPQDFARSVGASRRTGERWVSTGVIQRQYRKPVADKLKLPFEDLFPDFAAEEKTLRAQLDRIEEKLDEVLRRLREPGGEEGGTPPPPSRGPKRPPLPPSPRDKPAPRKRQAGSG